MTRTVLTLDDFEDLTEWQTIASGHAELRLSHGEGQRGRALRLDFDFHGGGGFVVARKRFSLALPDAYSFAFDVRGVAPANNLEFKLVDPSNKNVWRYHWLAYAFDGQWRQELLRSRDIEFAWGPAGGGAMTQLGAIEIVIAAGPGGKGSVWIEDLRFDDRSVRDLPEASASSALLEHEPASAVDRQAHTSWRPAHDAEQHWIALQFEREVEYGGLVIDWEPNASPRSFTVETSLDGRQWATAYNSAVTAAARSYVCLAGGEARAFRLLIRPTPAAAPGIAHIVIKPYAFSRSLDDFFHHVAAAEPRGHLPKYWHREQTYWTPIAVPDPRTRALINEEGMVEVDEAAFSIEPFVYSNGDLISWAQVSARPELAQRDLPIPSVEWRAGDLRLTVTAFAERREAGEGGSGTALLYVRYRLHNAGENALSVRLLLAVRPFQVTPPWQKFRNLGGVSPIKQVTCAGDGVIINDRRLLQWCEQPSAVGAACFDQNIMDALAAGEVPVQPSVTDDFGCASAALRYDLELDAGDQEAFTVAIAFDEQHGRSTSDALVAARQVGHGDLERVTADWRRILSGTEITLPQHYRSIVDTLHTAAAHILINRDGPALQPGPRRYTRSWIRDGAIMGAALLRMGCPEAMREFITWYAPFQRDDGFVPCCVDRDGVDWLVEHDSHGQLVYAVMEYYRFTRDQSFLVGLWPAVRKAIACIEALCATRLTDEFRSGEKRACYGLLPESASHEGYLAHPVHAYWDDFWALRGLQDGAAMAELLGESASARHIQRLHDQLAENLYASIRTTIAERDIRYIPGSVEWADFDPTATSNAIAMLDLARHLPAAELEYTYEEYLRGFRDKHSGRIDWNNYTAYEVRIVGALVRLGKRASAVELLEFFLADTRPRAWNQWPEITWRDPTSPGHQGDLPHTWIGAEYILSALTMFAYEREADRSLVVGAGIRPEWLDTPGGLHVRGLRTWYGKLDYTIERVAPDQLRVAVGGELERPPGGLVLQLPDRDEVAISDLPCAVVI